jgi:hypothetical protein
MRKIVVALLAFSMLDASAALAQTKPLKTKTHIAKAKRVKPAKNRKAAKIKPLRPKSKQKTAKLKPLKRK